MAGGRKGSPGERVLEGRHVIGLFTLMLLFSGVFFTLGYVMGRNQLDGQARAESLPPRSAEMSIPAKTDSHTKTAPPVSTKTDAQTAETQPPSDWDFYHTEGVDERRTVSGNPPLKPAPSAPVGESHAARVNVHPVAAPQSAAISGSYMLQVAALKKESDAHALARSLEQKKFPAVVLTPKTDKFYHVQVGPYASQKAADTAKKGLEAAGFKAIVKH